MLTTELMPQNASPKESHFERRRTIAEVLARHGFGALLSGLGLHRFSRPQKDGAGLPSGSLAPPQHVRAALEELGTTFIKLGQLLSTRADLVPPEYLAELAKLQDDAPPIDPAEAIHVIESELGQPVDSIFLRFDRPPLAAASIGQVHAAELHDGTEVIVKVRRPGVVELVEKDLEILHNLAASANRRWEFARRMDLVGLTQEFALTLRSELDYLREGQNADRFAQNFLNFPNVHIPRILWDMTTSQVLTEERLHGVKIADLAEKDQFPVSRNDLAKRGTETILKMVFEDGFFHADLHPGNFLIESDGRFGLLDFGMVGTLDEKTQDRLAVLILTLEQQDFDRLTDAILDFDVAKHHVDRLQLRRDLENLVNSCIRQTLAQLNIPELINGMLTIFRSHGLSLPSNLALLGKTLLMAEGIGVRLDPSFYFNDVIGPYAEQMVLRLSSPGRVFKKLREAGADAARLGVDIPLQLRHILGDIERGGFEVGMKPGSFEPVIARLERVSNRVVLGMIAAAFIVGLAVLLSVYHPLGWERWAGRMFAVGFFLAVSLAVYLSWSILRSGGSNSD